MPRVPANITNLTSGELSASMLGRYDVSKYHNGARELTNVIPEVHGPGTRRSGTVYVWPTRYEDRLAILEEFEFSVTQTYTFEFGDGYVRIYRDRGILLSTHAIVTADTGGDFFEIDGDRRDNIGAGDEFTVEGSTGNDDTYTVLAVTYSAPNTKIEVNETVASAVADGNIRVPLTLAGLWTEDELRELSFLQSADVLYVLHGDHQQFSISRGAGDDSDPDTWAAERFEFIDGPYEDVNTDLAATVTPAATTGGAVTVTASQPIFAASDETDGSYIRIENSGAGPVWGWGKINGYTSPTEVTVNVIQAFASTSPTSRWRRALFSTAAGWPRCATFHQQRFACAGSDRNPQTVALSQSGRFVDFTPSAVDATVRADDGLTYTISDKQVNAIRQLESDKEGLIVLHQGGVHIGRAAQAGAPMTALDRNFNLHDSHGCHEFVRPFTIASQVIFVTRSGREVRELVFQFEKDRFVAPNLNILATHILKPTVLDAAFAQEPNSLLYYVRGDGRLITCTYEREQDVVGWAQLEVGGSYDGGPAVIETVAVQRDQLDDLVWVIVKRTIDGQTRRYVEYFSPAFDEEDDQADGVFVDSSLTYDGVPASTFGGLRHLNDETVYVLADGARVVDSVEVKDGQITLAEPASKVTIGLPYKSRIRTMPLVAQQGGGDQQGAVSRAYAITLTFNRSLMGMIGVDGNVIDAINFRTTSDDFDSPPELFTGPWRTSYSGQSGLGPEIVIESDEPFPMSIVAISAQLQVEHQ